MVGRPFDAVTLVAFVACGVAAQGITARAIYSVARDDVLPASSFLRSVDRRQVPIGATIVTAVDRLPGPAARPPLGRDRQPDRVRHGRDLRLVPADRGRGLIARLRGAWRPAGHIQLGRAGHVLNVLAVVWLALETLNIAWPRTSIAPPGAPWYQVWAAPLVLAVIAVAGLGYLRRRGRTAGFAPGYVSATGGGSVRTAGSPCSSCRRGRELQLRGGWSPRAPRRRPRRVRGAPRSPSFERPSAISWSTSRSCASSARACRLRRGA